MTAQSPSQSPRTTTNADDRIRALLAHGQSVWLDTLSRDLVKKGGLQRLVERGVRGMTSNPTIFAAALRDGAAYDADIKALVGEGMTPASVFEALEVQDIQDACDVLRPIYDRSDGGDGFVSIEVSPGCARDTAASIEEGRRLWRSVARPNVMVKIPGTKEGWPAIEALLTEGVNVNITLLFSVTHHERVIDAYLAALEARVAQGLAIDRVASVASFFVSRVDTAVDKRVGDAQRGKTGIANAKIAYAQFRTRFADARFERLRQRGARVQRPLWASTGTKDPAYSDVMYVDGLIGADTVNTLPQKTLDAFVDHGQVQRTVDVGVDEARAHVAALQRAGVDLEAVAQLLEDEGVASFAKSYDELLAIIRARAA
jgi:transaldolase